MMKKLFTSILLTLCATLPAMADGDALNMTMKDGTAQSFLLSAKPVLTISDNNLTVTTDEAKITYTLYDVSFYSFGTPSGIDEVKSSDAIEKNGDKIIFHDTNVNDVKVYGIDGYIVKNVISRNGSDSELSLTDLAKGIYIIKVPGKAIKVEKK